MTDFPYATGPKLNEAELQKHLRTIERLTEQSGLPKNEIGKLYAAELERALESTRIRDFLPILIARKVKHDLRESHRHIPR